MTTPALEATAQHSGDQFDALVASMQIYFTEMLAEHGPALFRVDPLAVSHTLSAQDRAILLWMDYIQNFPVTQQQHHNCHACRTFIRLYGNLAVITASGEIISAIWPPQERVPELYRAPIGALRRTIARGRVHTVASALGTTWGQPITPPWTHFAVTLPTEQFAPPRPLGSEQWEAAHHEDYNTFQRALAEYNERVVAQAITILESETLYRAEKVIGPARFLHRAYTERAAVPTARRQNVIWRLVATAPPGFCNPRSTMIGTLLDDLRSERTFETVKRNFALKMNPQQYQRPQAAPSAGTIAQAEKLVAQLGIAPALKRRYATVEEVPALWRPAAPPEPEQRAGGVFAHLTAKEMAAPDVTLVRAAPMTWVKFAMTVLPHAQKIDVQVQSVMNFCALLTAVDPAAPPILQWDRAEQRNPFSWYVYPISSRATDWSLTAGQWVPVTAIVLAPHLFTDTAAHFMPSVLFVLDGAHDVNAPRAGLGLFPEILKAELHSVRAVIEAHSRSQQLENQDGATACGVQMHDKTPLANIRVATALGTTLYTLDRWD